jgi:hypothetical protein
VRIFGLSEEIANYAILNANSTITDLFYKKLSVMSLDVAFIISKFIDFTETDYNDCVSHFVKPKSNWERLMKCLLKPCMYTEFRNAAVVVVGKDSTGKY